MIKYKHSEPTTCEDMSWKDLYRAGTFPGPVTICPNCNGTITMKLSDPADLSNMRASLEMSNIEYFHAMNEYIESLPSDVVEKLGKTLSKEIDRLEDELRDED